MSRQYDRRPVVVGDGVVLGWNLDNVTIGKKYQRLLVAGGRTPAGPSLSSLARPHPYLRWRTSSGAAGVAGRTPDVRRWLSFAGTVLTGGSGLRGSGQEGAVSG